MSEPESKIAEQSATDRRSIYYQVSSSVDGLGPGPMAELRRMTHKTPPGAAFWRILAGHLEGLLPASEEARNRAERQWATLLCARAHLSGLQQSGAPLGKALAEAGFSELRVSRLLRAQEEALWVMVREVACFLRAKAQAVNWVDLVELVLSPEGEPIRRRISRDYFKAAEANKA